MTSSRTASGAASGALPKRNSAQTPLGEVELSLLHLQAEFARVDARIRLAVHAWQAAGQDPNDAFRGLYVSDAEVQSLLSRPLGSHWEHSAPLEGETRRVYVQSQAAAAAEARQLEHQAQQHGYQPRLSRLIQAFGLSSFEVDLLLICLAPFLDLRYERIYGYLQDDVTRKRPSVDLAIILLGDPGQNRLAFFEHFSPDKPLFSARLVRLEAPSGSPVLAQSLSVDETVARWLLGHFRPGGEQSGRSILSLPATEAPGPLLAQEVYAELLAICRETDKAGPQAEPAHPPMLAFTGPDRAGKEAAARLLANTLRLPLLTVQVTPGENDDHSAAQIAQMALRDAQLTGAMLYLDGWEAISGGPGQLPGPVLEELFKRLCEHPRPVIVASTHAWYPPSQARQRRLLWLSFPVPAYARRIEVWQHFMQQYAPENDIDHQEIATLAGQFLLTSDQIRGAVLTACDEAARRKSLSQSGSIQAADLYAAARAGSNPRLASLARKITPRFGWDDIILPADQVTLLHEIVATMRHRPRVLEDWGLGAKLVSSRGVTMLFSGPPGTGKTMGAEVISAELGLDLYKIDLSTVVSKYIGETEKNLERIFNEAEASNAILFFDEADALFGKRSEVKDSHDRYANIEISYLLQRMEAYDGATILATNLRANLDEAFTRRLQFAVDFPFPDENQRLRIWQALFPPDLPHQPNLDLALLARRFRMAGGNIRNIIVNAAYLAASDGGVVSMDHLLHGTRRELQKMGRLVGDEDLFPKA